MYFMETIPNDMMMIGLVVIGLTRDGGGRGDKWLVYFVETNFIDITPQFDMSCLVGWLFV